MKKTTIIALNICFAFHFAGGQPTAAFADSIRKACQIPELNYAVLSSDKVIEIAALGYKKINSQSKADVNDLFRIGSNTKAITGFLAALLIKEGEINWNTRFFDLFPELKAGSNAAYHDLNLLDLLTFRTRLPKYTYTDKYPTDGQITGSDAQQRAQFIAWELQQKPVAQTRDSISFSNLGYVLAGAMLEKVTGKPYKELLYDMGKKLNIKFNFGQPNNVDTLQPWGHNGQLKPEPPGENPKLNWLLAAGNITMSLPEYAKFIQLQLQGLAGKSSLLTANDYQFLHSGRKEFSVGWFSDSDDYNHVYSHNTGNPGTFFTNVYVFKEQDIAIILFANAQTEKVEEGENELFNKLNSIYIH